MQGVIHTAARGAELVLIMAVAVAVVKKFIECRHTVSRHRSALVKHVRASGVVESVGALFSHCGGTRRRSFMTLTYEKCQPINRRIFTSALTVVICVAIFTMLGYIASTDTNLRKMKLDLLDGGSPTSAVRNDVVSLDRRVSDLNACGFDTPFSTLFVFKNCTFNPHLNTARVL